MSGASSIEVKIHYEDTDCGGVVYYANYLRYFERARTAHLESLGIDMKALTEARNFFVVKSAHVDYLSPARYGDRLIVQSEIAETGGASILFRHVVTEKTSGSRLVTGEVKLVSVGPDGKVMRFSPEVAGRLKAEPKSPE